MFSLSALAAFDGRSSHFSRCVTIEPLFPEHRKEGRETGEEDFLDVNHCGRVGALFPKVVFIDLVDEDAEKCGGLVTRIWLKLGVDLDHECGCDSGKQTGLVK